MFEDALAGVEAGRAGRFGYVVGVDRVGQAEALQGPRRGHRRRATSPSSWTARDPAADVHGRAVVACGRRTLDLDLLAQTESVFALSNGHLGWRGNLDEGEPHGLPGTYLNGVYELRPLPYAEAGYGFPESGQTVINVTNGKLIRLFVDDEPFDVRYGAAALARARARLPRGRADPHAPNGCRRPGNRSGSPRPGWCRSPSGRSRRSATRWSRSTARRGSQSSPNCSLTSSCRRPAVIPGSAAALDNPLALRVSRATTARVSWWCTRPGEAGCGSARRWIM